MPSDKMPEVDLDSDGDPKWGFRPTVEDLKSIRFKPGDWVSYSEISSEIGKKTKGIILDLRRESLNYPGIMVEIKSKETGKIQWESVEHLEMLNK